MTLGKERETGPGSLLAHIKMQGAGGGVVVDERRAGRYSV